MPRRIISSNKGTALAAVLIMIAVLSIYALSYTDAAVYTYKFANSVMTGDTTFGTAQTASEKWFAIINDALVADPEIGIEFWMVGDSENDYVLKILNKISNSASFPPTLSLEGDFNTIYNVDFGRFEIYRTYKTIDDRGNTVIQAKVGIVSVSQKVDKDNPAFILSDNKRHYAEKEIVFPFTETLKVSGAIMSIGDVYFTGGKNANVRGDIFSFGTFPTYTKTSFQHYFGGIMAVNNTNVNIMGNVYTRSFLRTGLYANDQKKNVDTSKIIVTRDILAQGVTTFSMQNKIFGFRNCYTLDDLEINGEDSVIGINGSYLGLCRGTSGSNNHDESSCVLNSAGLHNFQNDNTKSRIVVNGDVIIPGSGFKLSDTMGNTDYAIESAGLVYPDTPSSALFSPLIPCYKYKEQIIAMVPPVPPSTPGSIDMQDNYMRFLFDLSAPKVGYTNIFQAFNVAATPLITDFNNASLKSNWMDKIDTLRATSTIGAYNNWAGAGLTKPDTVNGFSSQIMGANDRMYFNLPVLGQGAYSAEVKNIAMFSSLRNSSNPFVLDGFLPSDLIYVYKYPKGTGVEPVAIWPYLLFGEENNPEKLYGPDVNNNTALSIKNNVKNFWAKYWDARDIRNWSDYYDYAFNGDNSFPVLSSGSDADTVNYFNIMTNFNKGDEKPLAAADQYYHSRLGELRSLIMWKLNSLSSRYYPGSEDPDKQVSLDMDVLGAPAPPPVPAPGTPEKWEFLKKSLIQQSIDRLKDVRLKIGGGALTRIKVFDSTGAGDILINNVGGPNDYYVYLNEDPKREVICSGNFYGVIITKGRVTLRNGTDIRGSIIATGRDYNSSHVNGTDYSTIDETSTGESRLNNLDPNVPTEIDKLDDGSCSGVYVDTNATDVSVDFFCRDSGNINDLSAGNFSVNGAAEVRELNDMYSMQRARERLLAKFRANGLELSNVF